MGADRKAEAGGAGPGLRLLADTGRFAYRLFRSPRVPLATKLLLGGLGVYLVSPVDIIPDFVPVLGALDDAVIAAAVLGLAVKSLPREVIHELWESDVRFEDAVAALRESVGGLRRKGRAPGAHRRMPGS